MVTGLEHLLDEGVITEVLARLQSGKEAEVFVVRYGGKVVAAKVYKDRAHRSFKNNSAYKEGRGVRNSRDERAMSRGSRFGRATAEDAWKSAEVDALYKLHAADVRVPGPVMFLEGVLLMELVLDHDGEIAPRLIDMRLAPEEANRAYHDMLKQLVRILSCDLIHGDLSPYNVLWGAAGPTIIDFPQIISASHNSRSESFFLRDARNVLGHLASIDRSLQARGGDAREIWRAYVRRELTPDFLPLGRSAPPQQQRPRAVAPHPSAPQANRAPASSPNASNGGHNTHGGRPAQRPPNAHGGPPQNGDRRNPQHHGQARGPNRSSGAPHPAQGQAPSPRPNGHSGSSGGRRRAVHVPEVIVRVR